MKKTIIYAACAAAIAAAALIAALGCNNNLDPNRTEHLESFFDKLLGVTPPDNPTDGGGDSTIVIVTPPGDSVDTGGGDIGPGTVTEPDSFMVTLENGGDGAYGGGWYKVGAEVTVSAGYKEGWEFKYWERNVEVVRYEDREISFTMPAYNVTVTAVFEQLPDDDVGNLIKNGKFSKGKDGLENWWFYGIGTETVSVSNGAVTISSISNQALSYEVILGQSGLSLLMGYTYRLSFEARADVSRNIDINCQYDGNWEKNYYSGQVALSTTMQTFVREFDMTKEDDNQAVMYFSVGGSTAGVTISNVSLTLVGAMETYYVTVANGTGSGWYKVGAEVTISAGYKEGWEFRYWERNDGVARYGDREISFTMPAYNVTVTAVFEQLPDDDVGNLIKNGKFSKGEDGLEDWWFSGAGTATVSVSNGAVTVNIDRLVEAWEVLLGQSGLLLLKGHTYILSFEAKADESRNITVTFTKLNANGVWEADYFINRFALSTENRSFMSTFEMTWGDDDQALMHLHFFMGGSTASVTISNVSLTIKN